MAKTGAGVAEDGYATGKAITPHDSTNFAEGPCDAIYCGGAGAIVVIGRDGVAFTLTAALAGHVYKVNAIRVNSTSTTATNLVALRY